MKKKRDYNINDLFPLFIVLLMLIAIIFNLVLMIKYGDKPMSEVPAWVWWILH